MMIYSCTTSKWDGEIEKKGGGYVKVLEIVLRCICLIDLLIMFQVFPKSRYSEYDV